MTDWLIEQLQTARNLVNIAIMLRGQGEEVTDGSKLATILELLFMEAQGIIDLHCVVKKEVL